MSCFFYSLPGCVESEIIVKDKKSVTQTVKIDLFSNGENLLTILEAQFGLQRNDYRVRFRKKQVIVEQFFLRINCFVFELRGRLDEGWIALSTG